MIFFLFFVFWLVNDGTVSHHYYNSLLLNIVFFPFVIIVRPMLIMFQTWVVKTWQVRINLWALKALHIFLVMFIYSASGVLCSSYWCSALFRLMFYHFHCYWQGSDHNVFQVDSCSIATVHTSEQEDHARTCGNSSIIFFDVDDAWVWKFSVYKFDTFSYYEFLFLRLISDFLIL